MTDRMPAMLDTITHDTLNIARLEGRMQACESAMKEQSRQLAELHQQLSKVLETLSEARGGWRVLMWVAGVSSVAGGAVTWAFTNLRIGP